MGRRPSAKLTGMSPQFLVADLDRSIRFYTGQLGFDLDFRYEHFYAGIVRDGHSIHLKLADAPGNEREFRRENEHLDVTFTVEEIDAAYSEAQSRSVPVTQPLREMPYGREFYVSDPDGYILAFVETK